MRNILFFIQIILCLVLVAIILVQSRGKGLSSAWGGGGGTSFTRRGLERLIFKATFFVSALFVIISILLLLV